MSDGGSATDPKRRFSPRPIPTIFVVVALAILISLGTWQLNRYREKIVLEEEMLETTQQDVSVLRSANDLESLNGRRVTLDGVFLENSPAHVFKHRNNNGVPGYWVASMFQFPDGTSVLVNRGWFARTLGEDAAAELGFPETVVGLVHRLPRVIVDPKGRDATCDSVCIWETYDVPGAYLKLGGPERESVVVLAKESSVSPAPLAGYEHITQPYLTADRHLGYVATWYGMAAALFCLWLAAGFGVLGSRATTNR